MAERRDDGKRSDDSKSFLSRWSQRKREAEVAAPAPEAVDEPGGQAAEDDDSIDPKDLPDIDSLDASSDYSVFLKKGVPAGLKRKALNKLWQTDPAFRHICMLDDYNLDYTDAAMVVPNLKTLFQVGRGMVLPEDEEAERADAEKQAALPDDGPEELLEPAEEGQESLPSAAQEAEAPVPQPPTRHPAPVPPGTPRVSAAAARDSAAAAGRSSAPSRGGRSARQRRWGGLDDE